jgi:hypothetical protein
VIVVASGVEVELCEDELHALLALALELVAAEGARRVGLWVAWRGDASVFAGVARDDQVAVSGCKIDFVGRE